MPKTIDIRTMLYLGEDHYKGVYTSHFQVSDVNKVLSYGHARDGHSIYYGYGSIAESKRGFRSFIDQAGGNEDEDFADIV